MELTVVGPDGAELDRVTAAGTRQGPTEYEEVTYGQDAAPGEYEISVEGTADGEYTIEAMGETSDGGTIREQATETITEGETHEYVATVPESSGGEAEVNRSDGGGDSVSLLGLIALLVGFGTVLAGGVAAAAGLQYWLSSLGDEGD